MLYVYQAIGKSGRYVKGSAAAASISMLRADLARSGLALVDARLDFAGAILAALKPRSLPRGVLIDMFGYLRGLLGMGIDMMTAWSSVGEAIPNRLAKETVSLVMHSIQQGHTLTDAMERAKVFPLLVLGNVRAGEQSGTLEKVFEALEIHYREEQALSQQVWKATLYPLISVVILFFIGVGLLAGVVPQLKEIFPANPPLPTKILLFLSDGVVDFWWTVPGLIGGAVFAWWRLPVNFKTRVWEVFYRVPLVGPVLKNVALCNVFQNLSLMLSAGVSLTMALDTVIGTVTSRAIRTRLESVLGSIQRGGTFSDGFCDPFFPSVTAGVLKQGEMMGSLDSYLRRLSNFLRDRAQARLHTLATLIEPLLLLVGGGMLLRLAVGIFLPIYGQMRNIGR
ncbi:MAG: type II secretion system F family protein [Deltaproteobacteria bacterium]|nr:type II secretion system F family protein [Deltaproteobacteria bacterium]